LLQQHIQESLPLQKLRAAVTDGSDAVVAMEVGRKASVVSSGLPRFHAGTAAIFGGAVRCTADTFAPHFIILFTELFQFKTKQEQ